MQILPIYVSQHNRLAWVIGLSIGIVAGTVFTGLSVGLPIGLACCKWYPNYTVYNGYYIDDSIGAGSLYNLVADAGTKDLVQVCEVACNADSQCAVFDLDSLGTCNFYASDALSQLSVHTDTTNTGITYNAYVKSNSYTING